ncbi:MAG: glycosyltransferase [Deltaproteobacteria bacterium]|nr:glycosyltransferase [Deltaproteobacteria bacterium]
MILCPETDGIPLQRQSLRLLILNSDLPVFPGRAGHEYLHTTRLSRLAQEVGLVSLVHTLEQHEKKEELSATGIALYCWENPHLFVGLSANGVRPSILRGLAKGVGSFVRFWSRQPEDTLMQDLQFRNVAGPLLQALGDEQWQSLIVIQTNCARWLDYLPCFPVSVLVMHDVRALVYERQAQATTSWRKRFACLWEAWRYRHFEGTYCRKYDLVVTVSAADEVWVRHRYRPTRLVTIPIPVDTAYFAPMDEVAEVAGRVTFTGMMNHPPNVDAACFFARHVFPQVRAAIPEAEFYIVGRDPTPQVRDLASLPGVVITGFVVDIRPYIAQAAVVVVPLRFGSGMRNKILEAWGMQKCVVSTRIGAEGLDYQDDVNILIADDTPTMTDRVIRALRSPQLRDQLRVQARDLVARQHHPDLLAHQYYHAIESVWREKQQLDSPMRVLIDLRWMHPGVAGGIENLARSFLHQLLQLDGVNLYTILVPVEVKYDFDLRRCPNIRIVPADGPRQKWHWVLWQCGRLLHRWTQLDYWRSAEVETLRHVHALGADLTLSIPGYIHPDLHPLANVLIVPDIQHEYYPEFFAPQELAERKKIYTDSIKRASHLCAISEFTRQTLIERLGVPAERITTTPLAADTMFHPHSAYRNNPQPVLEKYRLPAKGYILFPGNTWPHKNHRGAFQALRRLRDNHRLDPLLVCTGSPKNAHPDLLSLIHQLQLDGRVRFLGYCPAPEMPALYEGAAALLFPSLFEGFGIPVLEAMWCDCPVVCSNTTSLPEIAGDAARLIDPQAPEEVANALHQVLTDGALGRVLIERGRQQAKKFSWLNFTTETVRILHEVREMRGR